MYYKTLHERLTRCGWEIIDESHEEEFGEPGRFYQHYFKYSHPSAEIPDDCNPIEFVCSNKKDGSPGRIIKLWQGGRPCRIGG